MAICSEPDFDLVIQPWTRSLRKRIRGPAPKRFTKLRHGERNQIQSGEAEALQFELSRKPSGGGMSSPGHALGKSLVYALSVFSNPCRRLRAGGQGLGKQELRTRRHEMAGARKLGARMQGPQGLVARRSETGRFENSQPGARK